MKLVISTIPPNEAELMAQTLVEEKLVACVNILPAMQSIYTWKEKICHDKECLLLMKTTDNNLEALLERIANLHSYEVPEIVSFEIDEKGSHPPYLQWIVDSVRP